MDTFVQRLETCNDLSCGSHLAEVVLPQVDAQLARPVQGRAYGQVGDQRRAQPCIEQREARSQHAGFCLQAADQTRSTPRRLRYSIVAGVCP